MILFLGSYQSGQMELTVNQLSIDFGGSNPSLPTDYLATCPCGAAVAHSLGKTGVMGSIPITGSRGFCLISMFSSQSDLVFSSEISRISTLEVQVALTAVF